ncbi:short-chain dehydrogenase [Mycena floridula]|nr:short-chain dehydrogenase [Mycena floridula]
MAQMTYTRFLREQWGPIPLITGDLSSRSILLTGAASGLGFEAATHLASMQPRCLLLTYRNTGGSGGSFDALTKISPSVIGSALDLTSFASVKKLVTEAEASHIDTFVGNAAMATRVFAKTEDGWETALQVNYLSNALLSILLLPQLVKNSSSKSLSRLVLLSSDGHHFIDGSKLPDPSSILSTLNDPEYCTPKIMRSRYDVSKMLLLMFATELEARLPEDTPVSVMNVNPGFCHSRLTRETESKFIGKILVGAFKSIVARPTEAGSRTIVHAVVTPDERKLHGKYITACVDAGESDFLSTPEGLKFRESLWRETIEALTKADARVPEIVQAHLTSRSKTV